MTVLALSLQAPHGVNLIRFFGNIDGCGKPAGYGYTDTTEKSILVSIDPITLAGTYNESNFKRFDLVLAEACKPPILMINSTAKVFNMSMHMHTSMRRHLVYNP